MHCLPDLDRRDVTSDRPRGILITAVTLTDADSQVSAGYQFGDFEGGSIIPYH
jgi:hypothetical protein